MNKILSILTVLTLIATISSCHRDSTGSTCPGTIVASWKADGEVQKSAVYVYAHVGTVNNFTLTACNTAEDRIVQLGYIPYPPVVGSYPLKWNITTGVWNGYSAGQYVLDDSNVSFMTDSTTHTGSFDIASVNTTNKTITGSFHFTALEHNGTGVVHITDGVFTNMKYE